MSCLGSGQAKDHKQNRLVTLQRTHREIRLHRPTLHRAADQIDLPGDDCLSQWALKLSGPIAQPALPEKRAIDGRLPETFLSLKSSLLPFKDGTPDCLQLKS